MRAVETTVAIEPEQVIEGPAQQVGLPGELPVVAFEPGPVGLRPDEFEPGGDVVGNGFDPIGAEALGRLEQRAGGGGLVGQGMNVSKRLVSPRQQVVGQSIAGRRSGPAFGLVARLLEPEFGLARCASVSMGTPESKISVQQIAARGCAPRMGRREGLRQGHDPATGVRGLAGWTRREFQLAETGVGLGQAAENRVVAGSGDGERLRDLS